MSSIQVFKVVVYLLSAVPLLTGGIHAIRGLEIGAPISAELDSGYRFLAAVWFACGLGLIWSILVFERQPTVFYSLAMLVFAGGVGRLISLVDRGWPDPASTVALGLEVIITPLLVWWASRLSADELSISAG